MRLFPESWRVEPASSVCSEIVDCLNKTAPTVEKDTGLKMIRTTNVKGGRINMDDVRFVEEKVFRKWTRRLLPRRNDIVLTREAPLGEVGLLRSDDKAMLGQRTMAYRADGENLNQIFLYYSLIGPVLQAQIKTLGSGSTVEHMRVPDAEKLDVPLPPIDEQKKIAALLSTYDDLIENNRRRIALLERMAEQLYREWFVRFRFPGYQQAKFEKGLPGDWVVTKLGDLYKTASGGTPSRASQVNYGGTVNWLKTGELKSLFVLNTEETISDQGLESSSAKVFPRLTVVMAMYCAMPDVSILGVDSATNQACWALLPKKYYLASSFTFYLAKYALAQMVTFAHGAAQQNLSQDIIRNFKVLLPEKSLVKRFTCIAAPIFDQIEMLLKASVQLTKTRDLLLPRLISGKLRVDDLDIQFPPSMHTERA